MARARLYIGAVVLGVAALSIGGCACGVNTYTEPGQAISVGVNEQFVIALDSNPTTGYSWQESYDETMLELLEKTYEPGEAAKQGLVGAGGVEYFRFKALKVGKTEITMDYKRPWEEKAIDQKIFTVNIG